VRECIIKRIFGYQPSESVKLVIYVPGILAVKYQNVFFCFWELVCCYMLDCCINW